MFAKVFAGQHIRTVSSRVAWVTWVRHHKSPKKVLEKQKKNTTKKQTVWVTKKSRC